MRKFYSVLHRWGEGEAWPPTFTGQCLQEKIEIYSYRAVDHSNRAVNHFFKTVHIAASAT